MSCWSSTWWKGVRIRRQCVSVQRLFKPQRPWTISTFFSMLRYGPALALSKANQSCMPRCGLSVVDIWEGTGAFFALSSMTTETYPGLPSFSGRIVFEDDSTGRRLVRQCLLGKAKTTVQLPSFTLYLAAGSVGLGVEDHFRYRSFTSLIKEMGSSIRLRL